MKEFPYPRLAQFSAQEDIINHPITVDDPSCALRIKNAICQNILTQQARHAESGRQLVILDYLGRQSETGQAIVLARDPARLNVPRRFFAEPSRVGFGVPCLIKVDDKENIVEWQEYKLIYPRVEFSVSSLIESLRDRAFGFMLSEEAENIITPFLMSYIQGHGPHIAGQGVRCGIELAPHDGISQSYEELAQVAQELSPHKIVNGAGELEEHSLISPDSVEQLRTRANNALASYRGSFGLLGPSKSFTNSFFGKIYRVTELEIPRNAGDIIKKDRSLSGASQSLSTLMSYMPVEYRERQVIGVEPQKAAVLLADTKLSKNYKHSGGKKTNIRLSSD